MGKTTEEEKNDVQLCFQAKEEPKVEDPRKGDSNQQDWRGLFKTEKTMGSLHYFEPKNIDGKVEVTPPLEAIEEGISQWNSSLVGQFFDKPLPYFLAKKAIDSMWSQFVKLMCILWKIVCIFSILQMR